VCGAKAILTGEGVACNTQIAMINDFDKHLIATNKFTLPEGSFATQVLSMSEQEPTKEFADKYLAETEAFVHQIKKYRASVLVTA
jgi:sulfite reductase (ferredoxin)